MEIKNNNFSNLGLIIIGLFLVLFSINYLLKTRECDVKSPAIDTYEKQYLKENPNDNFNRNTCLEIINNYKNNQKTILPIFILIGISFITLGTINTIRTNNIKITNKKNLIVKISIHAIYWIILIFFFDKLLIGLHKSRTSCYYDRFFGFFIIGFLGFYIPYLYYFSKSKEKKRLANLLSIIVLVIILSSLFTRIIPLVYNNFWYFTHCNIINSIQVSPGIKYSVLTNLFEYFSIIDILLDVVLKILFFVFSAFIIKAIENKIKI